MSRAGSAGGGRSRTTPDIATGLEPELLTVEQAAVVLGIGRTKVYELIGAGELRTVHIGKSTRVRRDEIRGFITRLAGEAAPVAAPPSKPANRGGRARTTANQDGLF